MCVVNRTNRQNVDNVSAITSICDSSEINVETIYDREEILHYFQTSSDDKKINMEYHH